LVKRTSRSTLVNIDPRSNYRILYLIEDERLVVVIVAHRPSARGPSPSAWSTAKLWELTMPVGNPTV
jgi:hypothetical protein